MYGYVYMTINKIDGKIYIGKRKAEEYDPNYYGSGKILKEALKKYGKENFINFMLCGFDSLEELNEHEKFCIAYLHAQEIGYNISDGGDGGNSYVDHMTEEELEEHWRKHKEIRTGSNNVNFGKHLYHLGTVQKYLADNEIEEYEQMGWIKGAADYIKEKCSQRYSGENNPFYGKKHSPETLQKIQESKEKRKKHFMYHKEINYESCS